jgi:hypothetical protein
VHWARPRGLRPRCARRVPSAWTWILHLSPWDAENALCLGSSTTPKSTGVLVTCSTPGLGCAARSHEKLHLGLDVLPGPMKSYTWAWMCCPVPWKATPELGCAARSHEKLDVHPATWLRCYVGVRSIGVCLKHVLLLKQTCKLYQLKIFFLKY